MPYWAQQMSKAQKSIAIAFRVRIDGPTRENLEKVSFLHKAFASWCRMNKATDFLKLLFPMICVVKCCNIGCFSAYEGFLSSPPFAHNKNSAFYKKQYNYCATEHRAESTI